MNLITGYLNAAHTTSQQFADRDAGIFGAADCVLEVGQQMGYLLVNNNLLRIYDGVAMLQGRECTIDYGETEEITIQNGSQGQTRNDIVVIRYSRDAETGVESAAAVIVQGENGGGDPAINSDTVIRDGASVHDMPLYRIRLSGINVDGIDTLFTVSKNIASATASILLVGKVVMTSDSVLTITLSRALQATESIIVYDMETGASASGTIAATTAPEYTFTATSALPDIWGVYVEAA